MAESFAFDIAHSLLGKLASFAYEEASRAYGVYDDLLEFKNTLSIVKGLLLDAKENKEQNHALREWLRQIRNICLDAEDVLDGFECQRLRKQVVKSSGSTSMKVGHFSSSYNPLVFRFRMAHQIKDVRQRLDKVAADGTKFGLADRTKFGLAERIDAKHKDRDTHSSVDSVVIGRENDRERIVELLMQPNPDGDKSPCVIPIVGIGGMGKTTLAKLVFNDKRMDELFQLKMWVCVSDDFVIKQIIIKIINSASAFALARQENIEHLDIEQLQSHLRDKLSGQKFLLVLDDIWNEDRAKWIGLENLLKVGAAGSKILVTTRNKTIASMMGTVPSPYVLEGLPLEDCLSLFVKWSFKKEGEEKKYPNLVEVGKEIVKKCSGVPLAVTTLGSSLFSTFDIEKWESVRDHDIWNLKQQPGDILPALKLSYDQMPSYLRNCFAYFSLFPKDFEFESLSTVTNLWLSVGLLQSPDGSEKPMKIAREYIHELHSRQFILDFEDFGHFYRFKVHDLVHDLAQYVAKEEFLIVDSRTRNVPEQVRHFSIVEHDSLGHALFPMSTRVRTILFPIGGRGVGSKTLLDTWVSRYKYLRHLDLRESSLETLPNSIGKLEHLRVLELSGNRKIKRLPHSVCKLQNLQVLTLDRTELETLPKGLGKLISLWKLYITTKQSVLSENEFASLSNLHTLGFVKCDNLKSMFGGAQVTSLEALVVRSCRNLETIYLDNLPKLETLLVTDCEKLLLSMNHEIAIERLRMKYLHLERCPRLQALPGWIEGAADTLQTLVIHQFPVLKMLPEWLTTMKHLKTLYIGGCPQLLSLPSDMHRLTALEELYIVNCHELSRKCQPKAGEYWPIIAHIKRVKIKEARRGRPR